MLKRLLAFTLAAVFLLAVPLAQAQEADPEPQTEPPVVHAVMFYLTTCPHCHTVIDEVLPVLEAEYGSNLEVLLLEASIGSNGRLFANTCAAVGVPSSQCGSVPLMVIGDDWLLGGFDIPQQAPRLIAQGIEDGGVPLPDVPGMTEAYGRGAELEGGAWLRTSDGPGRNISFAAEETVFDRLAADPVANAAAIAVLFVLLISLWATTTAWFNPKAAAELLPRAPQVAMIATGFAVGVALTLALGESNGDNLPRLLAIGAALLLVSSLVLLNVPERRTWATPLIATAGLIVAGYLTHVETTAAAAVCGAVGDCGAVQQSVYAKLFGVLPVGLLGLIGYVAIISAWVVERFDLGGQRQMAQAALLAMALFGTAFSAYLTFLEPFVIGATCMWCITSALTMIALLWLNLEHGLEAGRQVLGIRSKKSKKALRRHS